MLENRKILLTGAGGQLAKEFQQLAVEKDIALTAFSRQELDITDVRQWEAALDRVQPQIILNCAAYNLVDQAEKSPEVFEVNTFGVQKLASRCGQRRIFLVHFSTDYVFDGGKNEPYTEDDIPHPLNRYGESKLQGEEMIQKQLTDFLIFRCSWVFGDGPRNFLYKLLQFAKRAEEIKISADEISTPTYASDIARATLLALEKNLRGLFHFTNGGSCSRYEWAQYFLPKMGVKNKIVPVPASTFHSLAKRPAYSCLSHEKIQKALPITIPHWKEGVDRYVERFGKVLAGC